MKPRAEEQQALEAAQREFLAWLDQDWPHAKRPAFVELRAAAKAFSAALEPFLSPGSQNPYKARLVVLMQISELHQYRQDHYKVALIEVHARLLPALIAACDAEAGHARGPEIKHRTEVWIFYAADHWRRLVGEEPKAHETAPFWLAIEEFRRDERVPRIKLDALKRALAEWNRGRG